MNGKKNIRVLLIEDDEDDFILTRNCLAEILEHKYKLDWTPVFDEGLKALIANSYDAYLIDYRLGAFTGIELINTAVESGCTAPVILLTGHQSIEVDEEAMRAGASDYLVKGNFDSTLLDRSLRYAIKKNEYLQELKALHSALDQKVKQRTQQLAFANAELAKINDDLLEQIRERKIVEEEKARTDKLYYTICQNYPNGFMAVYNRKLEYTFVEGKLLDELSIKKGDIIGHTIYRYITLVSHESIRHQFECALNGEKSAFELFFKNRHLQAYAIPLPDADGTITQAMMVTQDITQRKLAIEEISNALEKERKLNELKSRFVSMASHEFRTPLGTILSSVALISRYNSQQDEEKRNRHINRIKSSVSNLTGILNDFLSLSKLEEGKESNNPQPTDIKELCLEVEEEMLVTAKPGQTILLTHKGDGHEINIDRHILKNIMINLLSNAIKYSSEGQPIYINTSNDGTNYKLEICDEGIGIPPEDQPYLFNTFFRAKNAASIQGTGLGLNIVKKYADLIGAEISFCSEPGKSTIFSIILYQPSEKQNHEKNSSH